MFSKTVMESFQALCSEVDTPRSLACSMLIREGEHVQYLSLGIDANHYLEEQLQKFKDDYLVTEYLTKYTELRTGIDTKAVAYSGFTSAEQECRKANRRIRSYFESGDVSPQLCRVISRAQVLIEGCIRSEPDVHKMFLSSRWGKGSTFSIKGEDVRIDTKVCEGQISVTRQAVQFVRAAMAEDIALLRARGIDAEGPTSMLSCEFEIVHGSRGLTVPKNAKTDRFIAAEPSGNIFIQLGYGGLIRSCLQRCGVNLDDQTVNQELARLAVSLGLATVDFSAASDTICRELVWLLLPFRWACALDAARSHMMLVEKKWLLVEKFSSMGNGFTFELESLIFWALTQAVCDVERQPGRVSVYGDDIICPVVVMPLFREVMEFCGFKVNTKKTHVSSIFRESCGEHYFGGRCVSPIYQKEGLATLEAYYRFHNRLAYHAVDRGVAHGDTVYCDKTLRHAVSVAASHKLTKPHHIPYQVDERARVLDGGLLTSSQRLRVKFNGNSFYGQAWVFIPDEDVAIESAIYAVHLRSGAKRSAWTGEDLQLYDRTTGHELAMPFTGLVTLRGRGKWSTRRRSYPQVCDVQWV